jgi:hypothetical protein
MRPDSGRIIKPVNSLGGINAAAKEIGVGE